MKQIILILLFFAFHPDWASGQALSDSQKPLIFLCPPCGLPCDTIHFDKPGICPVCAMKCYASYPEFENRQGEHGDFCPKKVAVLLFPGVEIIDFSGPWEVFGAAGMDVFSVAASDTILNTSMGLKIKPDFTFANAPQADIILVPGGSVDPADTAVVHWIARAGQKSSHTLSVCTGAFLLAAGGMLDGLTATTNYPAIPALRQISPNAVIVDKVRFVDNGRIVTAAGLSSGIDAAFHIVSLCLGKAQTLKLANDLEYDWRATDPFVRSKLADRFVQDFLSVLTPFDYEMTEYKGDRSKWSISVNIHANLPKADLLQIVKVQFEQVSGWKKTRKSNQWYFVEGSEHWSARLHHTTIDAAHIQLTLSLLKQ